MAVRKRKASKLVSTKSKKQKVINVGTIVNPTKLKSSVKQEPKPKLVNAKAELLTTSKPVKVKNYGITIGVDPYPEWPHPTSEECHQVCRLLTSVHGDTISPKAIAPPSLRISGCGEVPAVHDALLRTRLSAATTSTNANNAISNIVKQFGISKAGVGKGSIDWEAVRSAPTKKLFEAIECGGLAAVKSRDIKQILDIIYEENTIRTASLLAEGKELTEAV